VAGSTPNLKWQGRFETALRIVAPALDLMLAVGDRVSRVLDRDDPDHVPARMASEGESAPRGLRGYPPRQNGPAGSSGA
jgi:hypothetical protein